MGKNDDEEGPGGDDCPPLGGDEKLFCAPGYRVLVKDSIVIMSAKEAWRKKFPRRKFIRSLKIDCHRVAIKHSMCSKLQVCLR